MSDDHPAPADSRTAGTSSMPVPPLLSDLAGWTWRLLVLALAGYLFVQLLDRLYFIVLPFVGALLATSLAFPIMRLLRSRGLPRAGAAAVTFVLAGLIFGGVSVFVIDRAVSQYSDLVSQVTQAVAHFRHFLTVDLHVKSSSTASIGNTIDNYLQSHSSSVASGALSGITTVGEALAALVLFLFMTFFLLYDGANIWAFIVGLFPPSARDRVRGAGDQAWARLAGFVRGTFIIAIIHGVVAAVMLSILRVPLVAPLSLLIFIGSFLPIVGSIIFGTLAVAITFVTRGTVPGIILAGVLVVDNQVEAHLLQPLLVGRYVRLHPLAVAISIAGGGVLEGIFGAVLAVPFVAVVYAVLRYLATGEDDKARQAADHPDEPPPAADRLVPETG
ncbi:MAG TPA: AI-2E family transporter [Mycobacteriales bacterium]|nr:AI-2E family transporter [Mycobacteriales bacterium]